LSCGISSGFIIWGHRVGLGVVTRGKIEKTINVTARSSAKKALHFLPHLLYPHHLLSCAWPEVIKRRRARIKPHKEQRDDLSFR
jgi:hypothetical protein